MSGAKRNAPAFPPGRPFYLLHGDDEAAIEGAKSAIVESLLEPEMRGDNYTEFGGFGQSIQLSRTAADVLGELTTASLLPDSRRVAAIYQPADLFEARARRKTAPKKAKAAAPAADQRTASERLAEFIERSLPEATASLIIIVLEDYERFRRIQEANPLVQLAARSGTLFQFRDRSPQFEFFDALGERDTRRALTLWREWLDRAPSSPKPYLQLALHLRLMIQQKALAGNLLQSRGLDRKTFEEKHLPAEREYSVARLPDWRRDKLRRHSANFSLGELLAAYEELEPLQKYAIPLNSDPFVPDRESLAELWILRLTAPRTAA